MQCKNSNIKLQINYKCYIENIRYLQYTNNKVA